MNGNDILRAMNGLDDKFLTLADRERTASERRPRRIAARLAIGIAAAVALAIPAGAVYTQFLHRSAVMEYFSEESVKYIEDKGLALNISDENEHLRITVDTLLSDGNIGSLIMTVEAVDEQGREAIRWARMPELCISDAQTGEPVYVKGGGSWINNGADPNSLTQMTYEKDLQLDGINTDTDHILTFSITSPDDEDSGNAVNLAEGISIETSLRPNVQVRQFTSPEGETIWLSEFGFYSNDLDTVKKLMVLSDRCGTADGFIRLRLKGSLILKDIFVDAACFDYSPERPQPIGAGWFYELVDTDKVSGIKIGDTMFTEAD